MEEEVKHVPGQPFPKGVSGNPSGRPKGSKNKVTLYKLMAEESFRERNFDRVQRVLDDIVMEALAGDQQCRKLVWQAMVSNGSADERSTGKEKLKIEINVPEPEKAVVGEVIDNEEVIDEQ